MSKIEHIQLARLVEAIEMKPGATIPDLSRLTGLSEAVCSDLVTDLLSFGEIIESGVVTSAGQRLTCYRLDPHAALILGLRLFRRQKKVILHFSTLCQDGRVLESRDYDVTATDLDGLLTMIATIVNDRPLVEILHIAVPGTVNGGIIGDDCDLPGLQRVDLLRRLSDLIDPLILITNDFELGAHGIYAHLLKEEERLAAEQAALDAVPNEDPESRTGTAGLSASTAANVNENGESAKVASGTTQPSTEPVQTKDRNHRLYLGPKTVTVVELNMQEPLRSATFIDGRLYHGDNGLSGQLGILPLEGLSIDGRLVPDCPHILTQLIAVVILLVIGTSDPSVLVMTGDIPLNDIVNSALPYCRSRVPGGELPEIRCIRKDKDIYRSGFLRATKEDLRQH